MREPTVPWPLDELITAARIEGLDLTRERLHRWRTEGLMPTPELRSLGRGLGRSASYPHSALAQALMIGELLKRSRDLDLVRWLLFVEGFTVSMPHLRKQLDSEVQRLLRERDEVVEASATDDDAIAQRYLDGLASDAHRRSRAPLFRFFRSVVGRKALLPFLDVARRVSAGALTDVSPTERALVALALPIEGFGDVSHEALAWFADAVNPDAIAAALLGATDDTLLLARAEFLDVASSTRRLADLLPGVGPALALEIRRDPTWPPPRFFLLWLRNRDDAEVRNALAILAAVFNAHDRTPVDAQLSDD